MKKSDPKLASSSKAQVYLETRERILGREYKSNIDVVQKRIKRIKRMMSVRHEEEVVVYSGKYHERDWLLGRIGKSPILTSTSAATDPYTDDLTRKIRQDLEGELEANVNRKVHENMSMLLKKLGEANPDMKLDVGDFCATITSDDDDNGTPITGGYTS